MKVAAIIRDYVISEWLVLKSKSCTCGKPLYASAFAGAHSGQKYGGCALRIYIDVPNETTAGQLKIAVIDDHQIFLDGISLLVNGMEDAFNVESYNAPLDFLRSMDVGQKFDLIICDLIMNAMNGLAFVAAIRSRSKTVPILMLSGINTAPPITDVKRLGANGFMHKSADNEILKTAIQTLLTGGNFFTEGLGDSAVKTLAVKSGALEDAYNGKAMPKLAMRQIEVLRLIAEGATNKDVSKALSISENTVKTHLKQIFLELGVNKRTACVRKAQTLGLI